MTTTADIRPPSAITADWLRSLFASAHAQNSPGSLRASAAPCTDLVFALLTSLLRHDALESGIDPKQIATVMRAPSDLFIANERVSLMPDRAPALARVAAGIRVRLRDTGSRLRGANPLTAAFAPPNAREVPTLLRELHARVRRWPTAGSSCVGEALAMLAYAEFFAFLSIHPFPDGNGRTARWLYANRIHNGASPEPMLILALPISFAQNGTRFHLAAQLARAGTFDELFNNWRAAVAQARDYCAGAVDALSRACADADPNATLRALENIRSILNAIMR